jgi:hypothetical protein
MKFQSPAEMRGFSLLKTNYMFKDTWDSLKDNIKERISNPFLGTFVLVWVIHNWQIVYAFFFFDKDYQLKSKIEYFNNYWSSRNFISNLFYVAFITIIVLSITYLFLAISRYLANNFENRLIPFVSKMSKGNIYTEEQYLRIEERNKRLGERIEEERKLKNEAIQDRDTMEKRITMLSNSNLPELNNELKDYSKLINEANSIFKKESVEDTLLGIAKASNFDPENPIIDFFLKHGFIAFDKEHDFRWKSYFFTKDGERFKAQYFQFS